MKKISRTIIIVFAVMIIAGACLMGAGVTRSIETGELADMRSKVLNFLEDKQVIVEGSDGDMLIRGRDNSLILYNDGRFEIIDNDTGILPDEFKDKKETSPKNKEKLPDNDQIDTLPDDEKKLPGDDNLPDKNRIETLPDDGNYEYI